MYYMYIWCRSRILKVAFMKYVEFCKWSHTSIYLYVCMYTYIYIYVRPDKILSNPRISCENCPKPDLFRRNKDCISIFAIGYNGLAGWCRKIVQSITLDHADSSKKASRIIFHCFINHWKDIWWLSRISEDILNSTRSITSHVQEKHAQLQSNNRGFAPTTSLLAVQPWRVMRQFTLMLWFHTKTVWWFQSLWKIGKSIGMMTFPTEWEHISHVPVTTNQKMTSLALADAVKILGHSTENHDPCPLFQQKTSISYSHRPYAKQTMYRLLHIAMEKEPFLDHFSKWYLQKYHEIFHIYVKHPWYRYGKILSIHDLSYLYLYYLC